MTNALTYDWNDDKAAENVAKHGVDFESMTRFDWSTALTRTDTRRDYGETRFVSTGLIGARLHVCVWTKRADVIWIISLRKANERERKHYG